MHLPAFRRLIPHWSGCFWAGSRDWHNPVSGCIPSWSHGSPAVLPYGSNPQPQEASNGKQRLTGEDQALPRSGWLNNCPGITALWSPAGQVTRSPYQTHRSLWYFPEYTTLFLPWPSLLLLFFYASGAQRLPHRWYLSYIISGYAVNPGHSFVPIFSIIGKLLS